VISNVIFQTQFVRFLLVGVVNTAFSYGVYSALLYFGMNYVLASFASLVVGIFFSFKTQGTIVFGGSDNRRIFRFILVWMFIYVFNIWAISQFVRIGFSSYVSGALAIPFSTVLSYIAQKFFVFRHSGVNARR
jgi:putative flippase GtrA